MLIEIHKVKKRLTKTMLKQMPKGENLFVLDNCEEILGYVLNVIKGSYKSVLIKSNNEYYVLSTNWIKGEKKIYRKIDGTRFSTSISFKNKENVDLFWDKLQNILQQATKHIYI